MQYLKFKEKYHIEEISGEGIFLLSENENHLLEGENLRYIVSFIDGKHTYDDIIDKAAYYIGKEHAIEALNILINNKHIVESDCSIPSFFKPFWQELGCDSNKIRSLVSKVNVHIKTFGHNREDIIQFYLHSFGLSCDPSKDPSVIIVIVDDYQDLNLSDINHYALKYNIPWVLLKISGLRPFIGPFFRSRVTACWKCLETRLIHNREIESYIKSKKNTKEYFPILKTRIPAIDMQVASIAVTQLIKWLILGTNDSLESKIVSIDPLNLDQQSHFVVKRPQCSACGDPTLATSAGKPLYIKNQIANSTDRNGSRSESSENTFLKYCHHISDISGIIKNIVPSHWNMEGPIKTYMAGHNFALVNDDLYFIKDGIRSHSSGKGRTDSEAKTGALCEAIERYSGIFREGEIICEYKSFNQLNEIAIDPRKVMLFSEKQYLEREKWLKENQRFQVIPLPFEEDTKISWSPLWSLTHNKTKYLPTSYLYYGFKDFNNKFFCWGDSNGNAAGSCLEDAILQGFLELVERDSVCIWWYNRIKRPYVDLKSFQDPYIDELIDFYHKKEREFWILDITTDIGIPSFVAVNRRKNHKKEDIIMGFGAHLDSRIAVNRAITEMNQFIPAVLTLDQNGNSIYHYNEPAAVSWWQTANIENQPYLIPEENKLDVKDLPVCNTKNIAEQLEQCIKITKNFGMEFLVLDQTRPDIGLPVVKVIVPGLRHFWARFAPGRLYDVPKKMEWVNTPKIEEDLNPIAMFL